MISITNFFFQYQKSRNDFSLSLPNWQLNAGKSIVFYGASGCGKSTLLKCISGQILGSQPLWWDALDVTTLDRQFKYYAQHILRIWSVISSGMFWFNNWSNSALYPRTIFISIEYTEQVCFSIDSSSTFATVRSSDRLSAGASLTLKSQALPNESAVRYLLLC